MEHNKHIVIVCPACGGGGAVANVAIHHARELSRYFHVTLLSDSFPAHRENDVSYQQLEPWKFVWLRRFAHVPNEIAFAISAKRSFERIHAQNPVDFVMCHGHPVATIAAKPFKEKFSVPYSITTHGDIFDRPKGTYDSRLTWFYKKVTPTAYRHAALVIALSPYMKEMAIRGGADAGCVKVIPNGIDPEEIGLSSESLPPQIPVDKSKLELLYLGRLSVEKGVDILIDACGLLKKEGMDFRLRIAGDGPERVRLDDRIKALDLQMQIEFLGHISRRELGDLYRSAHLVCVPSRSDPLPTVVLEAFVAGTAVLGSNVGGIPYMIKQGVNGLIIPADDVAKTAKSLQQFAKNRNSVRQMGLSGRERALQMFTWTIISEQIANAIRDSLVGRGYPLDQ